MHNFLKITVYTIRDQIRFKSFYVLLGVAVLFIVMTRGCFRNDYIVNGEWRRGRP